MKNPVNGRHVFNGKDVLPPGLWKSGHHGVGIRVFDQRIDYPYLRDCPAVLDLTDKFELLRHQFGGRTKPFKFYE